MQTLNLFTVSGSLAALALAFSQPQSSSTQPQFGRPDVADVCSQVEYCELSDDGLTAKLVFRNRHMAIHRIHQSEPEARQTQTLSLSLGSNPSPLSHPPPPSPQNKSKVFASK